MSFHVCSCDCIWGCYLRADGPKPSHIWIIWMHLDILETVLMQRSKTFTGNNHDIHGVSAATKWSRLSRLTLDSGIPSAAKTHGTEQWAEMWKKKSRHFVREPSDNFNAYGIMALCHNLSSFRSLQIRSSCILSQWKINRARLIFGADDASASDFLKDGCDGLVGRSSRRRVVAVVNFVRCVRTSSALQVSAMHGLSAPAETGRWDDRKGEEAKTQENIEAETMQATLIEDEALLSKPTNKYQQSKPSTFNMNTWNFFWIVFWKSASSIFTLK